jgi:hypothetical protein
MFDIVATLRTVAFHLLTEVVLYGWPIKTKQVLLE